MTSIKSGYPLEIIKRFENEAIQEKFICTKCKLILRNPFQLYCGHRYCKECLPPVEGNGSMCPSCREEGIVEDDDCPEPHKTFPDNAIKREMASLEVVCVQSICPWEGRFKNLEAHLYECNFIPVVCDLCQKEIPRNKIQAHLASKCDTIDLEAFKCPFGCEDIMTDRDMLENHEQQNQSRHLRSVLKEVRQIQSKAMALADFPIELSAQASGSQLSQSDPKISRISSIEGAIVVLCKDLASIYDKVSDVERQQNRTDEELKKAQSFERQLLKYEALLHELQTRIDSMEKTSYDGFLIWKVEGYSKHKEHAVNGQITSIYSPHFFTGRPGYKICARLYLNGDGMGKGTHVSLFFVLMRGPHDAIMSWPFDIPVRFELMDLSGGKDAIVDTFRPDPSSSSFKRPTTNMNIASGCPTFVSLSDFEIKRQKYVKEDALFIRIEVSPHLLSDNK